MTIKMMLNKDEEINRLAQDPEVQIKIKNAIVDAIAKRAVKTIDCTEVHEAINKTIKETLLDDKPSLWPPLKESIVERVKNAAINALDLRLHEILADTLPGYQARFRQVLNEHLKEIEKLDFAAMAKEAVNRFIAARFSR